MIHYQAEGTKVEQCVMMLVQPKDDSGNAHPTSIKTKVTVGEFKSLYLWLHIHTKLKLLPDDTGVLLGLTDAPSHFWKKEKHKVT